MRMKCIFSFSLESEGKGDVFMKKKKILKAIGLKQIFLKGHFFVNNNKYEAEMLLGKT